MTHRKLTEYANSIGGVTPADAAHIAISQQAVKYTRLSLTADEILAIGDEIVSLTNGRVGIKALTPEMVAEIMREVTGREVTVIAPPKVGWGGRQRATKIRVEEPE